MLKYPVFIRSVTNLSDARYCAGMGVEWIGFCLDPVSPDYIEPTVYQGIAGWLSGVKLVAEFKGIPSVEDLTNILPDLVCTAAEYSMGMPEWEQPVVFQIDINELPEILPPAGSYLLFVSDIAETTLAAHAAFLKNIGKDFKVIIGFGFDGSNIDEIFATYAPYGFSLKGGKEIAPGLKTFDELSDILEAIEI